MSKGSPDLLISTLRQSLNTVGGELEVTVRFPQGRVELKPFAVVCGTRRRGGSPPRLLDQPLPSL